MTHLIVNQIPSLRDSYKVEEELCRVFIVFNVEKSVCTVFRSTFWCNYSGLLGVFH